MLTFLFFFLKRIPNKFDRYEGMPHYFWVFPLLKDSEPFHANVVNGLKWVLTQ